MLTRNTGAISSSRGFAIPGNYLYHSQTNQGPVTSTTIAVLPFVNTSHSEYEYFSDGITEEIINALTRIDALKVISRTSSFFFKNQKLPLKEIAAKLNAQIILEGSVRIANNRARITAKLIHAVEDVPLWSESWDRQWEDVFAVQDEVSVLVADKLREHLGHFEIGEHLFLNSTTNLEAYQLCLKARYHFNLWNPDDVRIAREFYEQSIQLDPYYVDAYVGLADVYGFMATTEFMPRDEGWQKAAQHIRKAMALNPDHAGAYYQLANLAFFNECDFLGAVNHNVRSLQLKPNFPEAQQFMAFLYILRGEFELAEKHLGLALAVNPLSHETLFYQAYLYYRMGDTMKASASLEDCLKANPQSTPALVVKAYCLLRMGDYDAVLHLLEATPQEILLPDEQLGLRCLAYVLQSDDHRASEAISQLRQRAQQPHGFIAHSYLFMVLANQGKPDEAFDWLQSCLERKSSIFLLSYSDPLVEGLQKDRRYSEFHRRLYPDAAREVAVDDPKDDLIDAVTAEAYSNKILEYIKEESPYLNPTLALRSLAELVQIHPNQLSWLINVRLGKNFNEFINGYRIEHFKKLARDPSNRHISLIGLAYESGFNSKTAFNTSFKKSEGITPSEYLKKEG